MMHYFHRVSICDPLDNFETLEVREQHANRSRYLDFYSSFSLSFLFLFEERFQVPPGLNGCARFLSQTKNSYDNFIRRNSLCTL